MDRLIIEPRHPRDDAGSDVSLTPHRESLEGCLGGPNGRLFGRIIVLQQQQQPILRQASPAGDVLGRMAPAEAGTTAEWALVVG